MNHRRRRTSHSSERPSRGTFALDGTLTTSAALLIGLWIVMNYSTTAALAIGEAVPPLALRHWAGVGVALLCASVAATLPLVFWNRVALPLYFAGIALLVATPFLGVEANGAQRWLLIPGLPFSVQPSERGVK